MYIGTIQFGQFSLFTEAQNLIFYALKQLCLKNEVKLTNFGKGPVTQFLG